MPPSRRGYLKCAGAVTAGAVVTGRGVRRAAADEARRSGQQGAPAVPTALRAEYEEDPDGVPVLTDPAILDREQDPFAPRFSWRTTGGGRGAWQSAYRLLVASTPELLSVDVADVYDSGKVESGRSTAVSFDASEPLEPNATYYWKVRVWDAEDTAGPWSESAQFTTAIPDGPGHWEGSWIGQRAPLPVHEPEDSGPVRNHDSPLLREEITLQGTVVRARAHVLTLGYGELYVNGERIGDAKLDPAWTAYKQRCLYSTYDVTDLLSEGTNALGLWLGRGWFSKTGMVPLEGHEGFERSAPRYPTDPLAQWESHGPPRALVQVDLEYADGTTDSVATDASWLVAPSPITENDVWDGERYNALLEQPGWATPEFDPVGWTPARELGPPDTWDDLGKTDPAIRPQRSQPVRVTETVDPVSIHTFEGDHVVDFGQNFAGWVELTVRDPRPGDEITLKYAEILDDDGDVDRRYLRTADAKNEYVAKGADEEVYEPRFTYHGFRYVKVEDYPGELTLEDLVGKVVHTGFEQRGSFACSNEALNRVQRNAVWGLRSCAHGIPTGCCQRDERNGWTADIHVAANADLYNHDVVRFYEKWLRDHAVNQGDDGSQTDTVPYIYGSRPGDPNWAKTQVTLPWYLYRHTGDERVLADHYRRMRAYVDFWHEEADDHIVTWNNYGDWLGFEPTDPGLLGTYAHYQTTAMVARAAAALGEAEDAATYAERAAAIADAFNEAFFDPANDVYGGGTQTAYALPLFAGIVPDGHEDGVAANLANKVREEDGGKLQTGFVGTRPLIDALVEYGHEDLAYHVVSQPEMPGWVYMVRNGATTMWERWDNPEYIESGMVSFNHRPWTLVSEWFYEHLAGISIGEAGFEHVEVDPLVPEDLEWAQGSLDTVRGEVTSRWERADDGLVLDVTVPWNSTGTVRVPDLGADAVRVREGSRVVWNDGQSPDALPDGVTAVRRSDDAVVVEVGSGDYAFAVTPVGDTDDDSDDGTVEPPTEDEWTDYTFESEFTIDRNGLGVIFRAQNPGNLYMWQLLLTEPPNDNAGVLKTHVRKNGTYEVLDHVPFAIPEVTDARHHLEIEVAGSRFTTTIDGQHVDTTEDATLESGTVGYRAWGGTPPQTAATIYTVDVTDLDGGQLFRDEFDHECVEHFTGGRIVDGALVLEPGDGIVLQRDGECE